MTCAPERLVFVDDFTADVAGATRAHRTVQDFPIQIIQEPFSLPATSPSTSTMEVVQSLSPSFVGGPRYVQATESISQPRNLQPCVVSVCRQPLLASETTVPYRAPAPVLAPRTCAVASRQPWKVSEASGDYDAVRQTQPFTRGASRASFVVEATCKGVADGVGDLDVLRMFPYIFTFSCCLVYLVPSWLTVHNGHDPSVRYFFEYWWQIVMLFPILFVGGHVMHVRKGGPWKPVVLVCCLVPSISLVILNDRLLTLSSDISDQLFSVDCDTIPEKRELDRAWQDAHQLYMRCLTDTVMQSKGAMTMDRAQDLYRIEDCDEYPQAFRYQSETWNYLAYCEEDLACSGWCTPGPRLWTFRETHDSCNVAVSSVFAAKVHSSAKKAVFYSVAVLAMVSVGIVSAGPYLRARNIVW